MSLRRPAGLGQPLPTAKEFAHACRRQRRVLLSPRVAAAIWRFSVNASLIAKRIVDIMGATAGIVALGPLLLGTAAAIRLESPGPVFFRQVRVGKRGKPFVMYKFRSMFMDAEERLAELMRSNESKDGVIFKMRADPRITRVGRVIRRLSIDELPQLLNVLRGEMSIVGPRPALPAEVAQYDPMARKRLQAKPGLTCLWQISGRSNLAFNEQIDLDLRYLQKKSLGKDIEIIARTVPAVISGKGAY